jgi:predicted RNA-binding Zn-ribbon protein involved in translation (DUF1610 family)
VNATERGRNAGVQPARGVKKGTEMAEPTATSPARLCPTCGGTMRRSHVAYLGRNQEATVYRCSACGLAEPGPPRDRAEAQRQRHEAGRGGRRQRALPDEGAPDNPVLDSDTARLLRQRLEGD